MAKNLKKKSSTNAIIEQLQDQIDELIDEAESYKEELDEYFAKIQDILGKRRELIDEAKKLQKAVKVLVGKTDDVVYDEGWSWKEKILYVIKSKKTFVTYKEIYDVLLKSEDKFEDLKERNSLGSSIRVTITRMLQSNDIVRTEQNEIAFFGLPGWLNDKGEIIDMYKNLDSKYRID